MGEVGASNTNNLKRAFGQFIGRPKKNGRPARRVASRASAWVLVGVLNREVGDFAIRTLERVSPRTSLEIEVVGVRVIITEF